VSGTPDLEDPIGRHLDAAIASRCREPRPVDCSDLHFSQVLPDAARRGEVLRFSALPENR
jgi:hypothetical protein